MVQDAIKCVTPADRPRFENQQYPFRCIAVRIILTTDLVNNFVAKRHVTEDTFLSGLTGFEAGYEISHLTCQIEVLWISSAIDEHGPVNVAAAGELVSSQRAENNKARVVRSHSEQSGFQPVPEGLSVGSGDVDIQQLDLESRSKPV
jgi:hypothetical protein